jgi:hypothetical protein
VLALLTVSSDYTTAMAASSRKCYLKLLFRQIDLDAYTDATASSSDEAEISDIDQVQTGMVQMSYNYATFETDRWKLDGSFVLPPESAPWNNVGWWTDEICGSDKIFDTNPQMTFTFTVDHSSIGFTTTFDTNNGEYAEEYTIKAYNSSNALIATITVTGNTSVIHEKEQTVNNYRKIELIINKWSNPYRRGRVLEFVFGILKVYTGQELTNVNILEEISTTSKQVTANELEFSIDNQDQKFDFLNPAGVYTTMQKTMKIDSFIGVETFTDVVEYAKAGTFYLTEWNSLNDGLIAKFKARDKLDLMTQTTYKKGLYQSRTLTNLATDVLTDFGFSASDYNIDTALNSITVYSYIPVMSHRDALQLIAIAGQAVVYVDRNNVIQIDQLSNTLQSYTLSFANSYNKPITELAPLVKNVEVSAYSFNSDAGTSEIYKGTLTLSGTVNVWVDYSEPATGGSASLSSGTLNSATYYTNGALLNITKTGDTTITVTGYKLNSYKTPVTVADQTDGATITVDNILISNATLADTVADWIIVEEGKKYISKSTWRQNPAIEAGDRITVENVFDDLDARVTKQVFRFNGALSGESEARG